VGIDGPDRLHPHPRGHRRFRASEVNDLLADLTIGSSLTNRVSTTAWARPDR
jgi:hypothetical protein